MWFYWHIHFQMLMFDSKAWISCDLGWTQEHFSKASSSGPGSKYLPWVPTQISWIMGYKLQDEIYLFLSKLSFAIMFCNCRECHSSQRVVEIRLTVFHENRRLFSISWSQWTSFSLPTGSPSLVPVDIWNKHSEACYPL